MLSTASQGMQAQTSRLSANANNIANISTSGYTPLDANLSTGPLSGVRASVDQTPTPPVNEATEITSTIEAENAFQANASVFETGADLWQVLATIRQANSSTSSD